MAEQESQFDKDTFDHSSDAPGQFTVGDNIDFDESLPANDKETSSLITDNENDEAAQDAKEDGV